MTLVVAYSRKCPTTGWTLHISSRSQIFIDSPAHLNEIRDFHDAYLFTYEVLGHHQRIFDRVEMDRLHVVKVALDLHQLVFIEEVSHSIRSLFEEIYDSDLVFLRGV